MTTAEGHFAADQRVLSASIDLAEDTGPVTLWGRLSSLSVRVAWVATVAHIMAMIFALIGILYVIPNLADFVTSPSALRVYNWGMSYGGATHMILGAVAVFALGVAVVGPRRTLLFFVLAYLISAGSELVGTSTGWPFGNYSYTDYLGYRLVDHVPFTIPLSWFYMGMTSYFLARLIVWLVGHRLSSNAREIATIILGGYLVVVWDLVLDPAMAHDTLSVRFWEWKVEGAYFGMPVQNYAGWLFTAILFMTLGRLSWNSGALPSRIPLLLPVIIYGSNIVFASALSLSVGLWLPIVLCVGLVLLPAAVALLVRRANPPARVALGQSRSSPSTVSDGASRSV
jgi:carotene biosynthesis associated membrane protein